jgi:hypothetical protein
MVKINDEKRSATIEVEMCESTEILEMQLAIIDLLSCFNYKDFGSNCDLTVVCALQLLKALLLDADQMELALGTNRGFIKIPENININTRMDLVSAIKMINAGETVPTDNPFCQALTKGKKA